MDRELALARWSELDGGVAIHPADHALLATTATLRSLILERLVDPANGGARDLFNACAALGRAFAAADASPSLAAVTLDGAASALEQQGARIDPDVLRAARSAFAEGYVAGLVDRERAAARRALAYPATVVPLGGGTLAIAAVHPADDGEALRSWAGDVAARAAREGTRRVLIGGDPAAKAALEDAFATVGVEVADRLSAGDALRLAFGRRRARA